MAKLVLDELFRLPATERLAVAQQLWDSVTPEEEAGAFPLPDWQRQVLAERLADLERNPADEEPWEQVRAELWPGA